MYVIIKAITTKNLKLEEILNIQFPKQQSCWSIRKRNDGFVADISNTQNWEEIKEDILTFLKEHTNFINFLNSNDFDVVIDIEIDRDDVMSQNYTLTLNHDFKFLKTLIHFNVSYDISLYIGREMLSDY